MLVRWEPVATLERCGPRRQPKSTLADFGDNSIPKSATADFGCHYPSRLAATPLARVTIALTYVSVLVTYTPEPRPSRTRPGRQSRIARASAVPAGGLATRPRAALGIISPAPRPEREVLSLDWDRPGRVTPAQRMRKTCPAASQEAWPEAESLAMKGSLGREPRWNADRCAPPRWGARPWPMPRQNTNCVCRRFASDSLPFFHSFVARMERSAIREHDRSGAGYPGFRFASSGLHICEVGLREEQGRLHHLSLFALRFRA